jgi:YD repeat-containing protein
MKIMKIGKSLSIALAAIACLFSLIGVANAQADSCQRYNRLVSAHASSCLLRFGWDSFPMTNPPQGLECCNPFGVPFGTSCAAPTWGCGPNPDAAAETCLSCARMAAGEPINLSTGNTYITELDVALPGLGGGLSLSRTWNSMLPPVQNSVMGMFGINWRSTYEERLIFVSDDSYVKYLRGDGNVWSFGVDSLGTPNVYKLASPAIDTTTAITDGASIWTMTFKSGEKRLFDSTTGLLMAIIDRNNNATQLSYDSAGRLSTVTDPASRHLYFNYASPSSTLVISLTCDFGVSLSYQYDTQGRLTQVTRPDTTTVAYQYDSNSKIITVLDSEGKILESHTYDVSGRGLTSSRANGVDSVTVSYPQ